MPARTAAGCWRFTWRSGWATLAKGPVRVAAGGADIWLLRRAAARLAVCCCAPYGRSGSLLYLVVPCRGTSRCSMPIPEFFRIFILQQNVARYTTDFARHAQPFWFFLPVALLALVPWTCLCCRCHGGCHSRLALLGRAATGRRRPANLSDGVVCAGRCCFSRFSRSKLPGYILPAIPAAGHPAGEFHSCDRSSEVTSRRSG